MKYQEISNGYIVRFEQGEEILSVLSSFVTSFNVLSCTIQAIGSVQNPRLAYYNLTEKAFEEREFFGDFELISCLGSIGFESDSPLIHLHASISNKAFEIFGGHVKSMTTLATVELVLSTLDTRLSKSYNNTVGLKLFDLECEFPTSNNS